MGAWEPPPLFGDGATLKLYPDAGAGNDKEDRRKHSICVVQVNMQGA